MVTHLLSNPETGWIDKFRSGKLTDADDFVAGAAGTIFTANGAGTTTTLVGAAANLTTSLNCARIGERFVLVTSAGAVKENTVFTVTAHNGTTTITFTPAAAASTASGDKAVLVSGNAYTDNASLDQKLLAIGGVYTQAYIDKMTQNDKVYAIRQFEQPESVK
jgi:hypothetical protein